MALNPRTLAIGGGWMAVRASRSTSLYRRYQGLPLTKTVKVETPEPLGVEEVEYQSVLVAFEDDAVLRGDGRDGGAARRRAPPRDPRHLAARRCRTHLPLDAPLEGEEGEAQSKIEQAKLIGGLRVTRPRAPGAARTRRATRSPRRREEIEASRDRDAAALPQRRARCTARRSQTVLAERPCRVIVVGRAGGRARGADGDAGQRRVPRERS